MEAAITNLSSGPVFIPGPNLDIPAGETKSWSGISVGDLDKSSVIKAGVVAGTLSVAVTPDTSDAAVATVGALGHSALELYAFADLPTGFEGRLAFVTDGRRTGQGGGLGTGVPAYYSAGSWRVFFDDTAVAT